MKKLKKGEQPYIKPPKDQMLIHDTLSMTVQKKKHFPEHLVRLLIALCGSIGTLIVLQGFFDFPIQLKPLLQFLLVMTLILRAIRMISPKIGFACILASFASIPFLLLHYRQQAVAGAGAIYHIMRKRILWRSVFFDPPVHANGWSEELCIQFVFFMMIIALSALLEYSDVLLTHPQSARSGFWIRFLVTFPFLECGLYFGIETSSVAVFMLVVFWVGTIALARHKASRRTLNALGISSPLQIAFTSEISQKVTTHETGVAYVLTVAAALSIVSLLSSHGYARTEKMDQQRRDLRDFYQNITIEDVTGLLDRIPTTMGVNVVTDEVDLVQNSDLYFDGRPVLHLEVGAAAAIDDYYLRGVVRSEYTGRGWGLPTGIYRNNQRLFRRLTAENRMPQTMFISDHIDELRTPEGKFPVVRCDIEALTYESVNFLPYQSIFDVGTRYRYDIEIEMGDTKKYSFWLMNNAKADWADLTARQAPSENALVSDYEKFVEKEYVKLPNSEAIQRLQAVVMPDMPAAELPLDQRLAAIRDYIWARAEYTMQPGAQPEDEDFVEYFLMNGHKGYCAHYASAAVVLCRMCGIPARYCQGYVLTENDFLRGADASGFDITIPDHQAHAWAEIYVKGFGWVPFEFTETVYDTWHQPLETTPTETVTVPMTTETTAVTTAQTTRNSSQNSQSEPEQTTTAAVGEVPGGLSPKAAAKLMQILKNVLIAAAVILLWYLLHKLILLYRDHAMHDRSPNRAAQSSYLFLMYLLHIQGLDQKKLSHDEFSQKAEEECKLLPAGRITRAIDIQQAAVFSRDGVTQAEAKVLCKTAQQLAKAMYQHAGPLRKLWLRWGRHII